MTCVTSVAPVPSPTFTFTRRASGAIVWMMPAMCVPWPYESRCVRSCDIDSNEKSGPLIEDEPSSGPTVPSGAGYVVPPWLTGLRPVSTTATSILVPAGYDFVVNGKLAAVDVRPRLPAAQKLGAPIATAALYVE